jgi:hypothetical protein
VEAYLGRQNVIAVVQDNFNPDNVSSWDLLSRCIPTRWIDDCLEADALLPFDGYRFSQPSPAAQRKRGAQYV